MLDGMGIADLAAEPDIAALRARYAAFMDEHVYPNERRLAADDHELIAELRGRARAEGLWSPHLPPEAGGTGLGFLAYAHLNEVIGRVPHAQLVFNCQAPDAGNGEILHLFGTPEQKERWLRPLVEGDVRSFFSMTEPDVAGSDPTTLRARAVRGGPEWVIDGRKPGQHRDGVRPPRLRRPRGVVAQPLSLLREPDELPRVRPRRRVAHVEAEAHHVRC